MRQIAVNSQEKIANPAKTSRLNLSRWVGGRWFLNRGVAAHSTIALRSRLPLVVVVLALLGQFALPDPIWVMVFVTLGSLYLFGYLWVRSLASGITLERRRSGEIIVTGDAVEEEFQLTNRSIAPALWVEVQDGSNLPGYEAGRVVGCPPRGEIRWRLSAVCHQRGLFRLGPLQMTSGDPFRLFSLAIDLPHTEPILIYPRVVQLPEIALPVGHADADARVRRTLFGVIPAPSVREHAYGESLRHVHWAATAHHGRLMVREREQEPAGDIWVVLDGNLDDEENDLFEFAVTTAASVAVQLLSAGHHRKVGLLCASGDPAALVQVHAESGQPHVWRILSALAPVARNNVEIASLMRESRYLAGGNSTLVLVTGGKRAQESASAWCAEIVRLAARGIRSSVVLLARDADQAATAATLDLLVRYDTPAQQIHVERPLPPRAMVRRTRRVVKTTPSGGSFSVEIEEDVG